MPIDTPWALPAETVVGQLGGAVPNGLASDEAHRRLEQFGPNRLKDPGTRGPLAIFLHQFVDFMIGLLAVAALISACIGDVADTILIAVIVLLNAVIGFMQEWKAQKAAHALKKLSRPTARVWRDGMLRAVAAADLVPGDLIEVAAGDVVPADARVVSTSDLEVDEASLTGESLSVEKTVDFVPAEAALSERQSMVYSGTPILRGRGRAVVTTTGMETELGKIAAMLESAERDVTPLQRRLSRLSRQLAAVVVAIAFAVFLFGLLREGRENWDRLLISRMLLTAVSLAVAAIPEGLPAVITVTLTLGSQRMARRKAIIRKLAAVEALGSVNVIMTDKTGTLTRNEMAVCDLVPADSDPTMVDGLLTAGALCNDAAVSNDGKLIGSATERALLRASLERGLAPDELQRAHPRVDEIPFSSARKRMTTLHRDGRASGYRLVMKGAAEPVLARSSRIGSAGNSRPLGDRERSEWLDRVNDLASGGRRVLALATRAWEYDSFASREEEAESGMIFLGLVGIVDPVRTEAKEAIRHCLEAGIRPVMITGDHVETAKAVASEVGLLKEEQAIVTGPEVERMSDQVLADGIERIAVFARTSPEHKLRIVKAWQSRSAVAAMTGDGVNDAPALKHADVGVAMGITGTDVAKEAADMILADDNFATIVAAVEEGRIVYDNIRKFVAYLLTTNAGEVLTLVLALCLGFPAPLLPVHILWINLVTDGLPALALGFEPAEPDLMRRRPRPRDESLFARGMGARIVWIGLLMGVSCVAVFWLYCSVDPVNASEDDRRLAYARTMVFLVLSASQLFYVLGIRSRLDPVWQLRSWTNIRLTCAVFIGLALQLAVTYVAGVRSYFHTMPLALRDVAIGLAVAAVPLAVLEVEKARRRARPRGR